MLKLKYGQFRHNLTVMVLMSIISITVFGGIIASLNIIKPEHPFWAVGFGGVIGGLITIFTRLVDRYAKNSNNNDDSSNIMQNNSTNN